MKERSKERYAALLLEELLERISERENIRQMLGEMIAIPVEDLIDLLLHDFESIVQQRCTQTAAEHTSPLRENTGTILELKPSRPADHQGLTSHSSEGIVEPLVPTDQPPAPQEVQSDSSADQVLPGTTPGDPPVQGPPAATEEPERQSIDELLDRLSTQLDEKIDARSLKDDREGSPGKKKGHDDDSPGQPATGRHKVSSQRIPYTFGEHDHVYLHAVAPIPAGEQPAAEAFMLEEKGIDQQHFAFVVDHEGFRLYLSKFQPDRLSVAKSGVLLLGKQDGIQLQGVHHAVLNDLRVHNSLLPFEFGTIARSQQELLHMIDLNAEALRDALAEVLETRWWTVNLMVLDERIEHAVGEPAQNTPGRSRERERPSIAKLPTSRKFDIKVLERILQKEKKLAESVHATLDGIADRSDIDQMVGLTSGSSEDWKVILKASYEIPERRLPRFNRAIVDLQYDHILFDLLLSVEGKRDLFRMKRE
jgi:Gas vesicle synthesis protein GvpL/GvpF